MFVKKIKEYQKRFREYSVFSRWLPIALVFVSVAVGGAVVQSNEPEENAKSLLKTMLNNDFFQNGFKKEPQHKSGICE